MWIRNSSEGGVCEEIADEEESLISCMSFVGFALYRRLSITAVFIYTKHDTLALIRSLKSSRCSLDQL